MTRSAEETIELARRIAVALPRGAIFFLDGPMGAGKTVFAKGLYLGIGGTDPGLVLSPSYTVVNRYDDCDRPYYHVDLYRLEDERLLLGMEYEEFLYENPGLTVVEWPRTAPSLLRPDEYITAAFDVRRDGSRRIDVTAEGDRYTPAVEAAAAC